MRLGLVSGVNWVSEVSASLISWFVGLHQHAYECFNTRVFNSSQDPRQWMNGLKSKCSPLLENEIYAWCETAGFNWLEFLVDWLLSKEILTLKSSNWQKRLERGQPGVHARKILMNMQQRRGASLTQNAKIEERCELVLVWMQNFEQVAVNLLHPGSVVHRSESACDHPSSFYFPWIQVRPGVDITCSLHTHATGQWRN